MRASGLLGHSILASGAAALGRRQECPSAGCPDIQIFTAGGGGTIESAVNLLLDYFPEATAQEIPISYGASVGEATNIVAAAVNDFHGGCPSTKIALIGYAQGARLIDNVACGGPDETGGFLDDGVPLTIGAINATWAVSLIGDPRYRHNDYNIPNIGGCKAQGPAARPPGSFCSDFWFKARHWCDAEDTGCCTGVEGEVHEGYEIPYAEDVYVYIQTTLTGEGAPQPPGPPAPPVTTTTTTSSAVPQPTGPWCSRLWAQCGGQGWTGPTCCQQGTCIYLNQWHSQCLN